jgi:cytochrome c oxidase subunit 4
MAEKKKKKKEAGPVAEETPSAADHSSEAEGDSHDDHGRDHEAHDDHGHSHGHGHGHHDHAHEPHQHPPYVKIFFMLGALTIIEIAVAYVALPISVLRTILLALAFFKAAVVALYYMHLRFERLGIYVVALSPLFFAGILMSALFWEIVLYPKLPVP